MIARGTGDELKAQVGGQRLEFTFGRSFDVAEASARLRRLAVDEVQPDLDDVFLTLTGHAAEDGAQPGSDRPGAGNAPAETAGSAR